MHNFVVQVWHRGISFKFIQSTNENKTCQFYQPKPCIWSTAFPEDPEDGYKNCTKTYSSWRINSIATECLNIHAVPLRCMSTDRFNSSPELESANNSPSKQRCCVELEV